MTDPRTGCLAQASPFDTWQQAGMISGAKRTPVQIRRLFPGTCVDVAVRSVQLGAKHSYEDNGQCQQSDKSDADGRAHPAWQRMVLIQRKVLIRSHRLLQSHVILIRQIQIFRMRISISAVWYAGFPKISYLIFSPVRIPERLGERLSVGPRQAI
jgi:hypothetical protein